MKKVVFLILLFASINLYSQPDIYKSRGTKSYLVNYSAIKGSTFLARLAARRFVLIDEGWTQDIKLVHKFNPSMPILLYKDIIALHQGYPEFPEVNLQESAFMHTTEPSGTVVYNNKGLHISWLGDKRDTNKLGYKVYYSDDSITFKPLINYVITTNGIGTSFVKGTWFMVKTVLKDSTEIDYGFPVKIMQIQPDIQISALNIDESRTSSDVTINILQQSIGKIRPDSVIILIDLNRDNQFNNNEYFKMTNFGDYYEYKTQVTLPLRSYGGYEFKAIAYKSGKKYIFPENGSWSTNLNNRTKNDYYGNYTMNVCSPIWRNSYIEQIKKSFENSGYNGLFEDDCIIVVSNWVSDAPNLFNYTDSAWKVNLYGFMDSIKSAIAPKPAYFNGLYTGIAENLLPHSDGGMSEGFGSSTWANQTYLPYWSELANVALRCQKIYNKTFMALGGIINGDPETRIYVLASYLMIQDTKTIYGNANNYQDFAHYPEFDIPMGAPKDSAYLNIDDLKKFTEDSVAYYVRNFANGTVIVNPNPNKDIVIPGLKGRLHLMPDNLLTVDGGRLNCVISNTDTIYRKHARIFLNNKDEQSNYLVSPYLESATIKTVRDSVNGLKVTITAVAKEFSSDNNKSDVTAPFYITAEAGAIGGPAELILKNDGSPASSVSSAYSASFNIAPGFVGGIADIPITIYSTTGLIYVNKIRDTIPGLDSTNILPNFSFEFDTDENNIPDNWRSYSTGGFNYDTSGKNFVTGKRSVYMICDSSNCASGIYTSYNINQSQPEDLKISGWSKAENVSGSKSGDYSIYVDCYNQDGTSLYGQTAIFSTGTHNWEYSEKIIHPAKPIKTLNIYCLLRNKTGKAWFDQISLSRDIKTTVKYNLSINHLIEIYPNPVQNVLNINIIEAAEPTRVKVYDMLGRQVIESLIPTGETEWKIDMEKLQTGVYLLKINGNFSKFVKY